MAVQDLLSQDEIDALLHGVDDGAIDTDLESEPGSIKSYDLTSQDRIVRGRMPTLEMINERFARYTRISMFNLMRRSADVAVGGVQVMKFGEYVHSLAARLCSFLMPSWCLSWSTISSVVMDATPRSRVVSLRLPSCG